jgi:uncharacterized membrane protein
VFEYNVVDVPSDTWWLDTDVNIHVTNSLQELQSIRKPSNGELKVNMGKGVKVKVEYIGTAKLVANSLSLFLFWTNVDTILKMEMEWLSFIIILLWLVLAYCVMVYTELT